MCTAAPAVPKCTLLPHGSRSWRGSCAQERKAPGGTGDTSSTRARGKLSRPMLVDEGAARGAGLDAGRQRLRHAQPLEHVERTPRGWCGCRLRSAGGSVHPRARPGPGASAASTAPPGAAAVPHARHAAAIARSSIAPTARVPHRRFAGGPGTQTIPSSATGELDSPVEAAMLAAWRTRTKRARRRSTGACWRSWPPTSSATRG